ncbi:MAG: MBL fold metallo-hydrolase [Fervidicoccaceae archaeon]
MKISRFVAGPLETNTYLLYDERALDAVVVDAGGPSGELLAKLRDLGLKLRAILITHGHLDHFAWAPELRRRTGAPIYLHRDDLELAGLSSSWGLYYSSSELEQLEPDALLEGGERLRLGEIELEVLSTPGHSPGSISIYSPASRSVFVGDTLFAGSVGRTDLPGGSEEALLESLRELCTLLPPDTEVYPGHGPSTTLGAEIENNPYVWFALRRSSGAPRPSRPR